MTRFVTPPQMNLPLLAGMTKNRGFSLTSCPHPESAAQILTSPSGRGKAHAPRPSHLSPRERSASKARRVRACLPTIRPHPESAAQILTSPSGRGKAHAPRLFHLSPRERSKSSFMISGEGSRTAKEKSPHPNFDRRNPTSPGGRGREAAFSLIELAIVLVILGLLVGGIMTGQSLIRAAELRSITTDLNQFQTSISVFRAKYSDLPGDMPDATAFWGAAHATPVTCATTVGTGTQTCNGDGNGQIGNYGSAATYYEVHRMWQHLANTGLIEGSYTGVDGGGSGTQGYTPPRPTHPSLNIQVLYGQNIQMT